MEKIVSLLTTTEGRIGRQQWWIGVIAMVVISIIASIILGILSFGNAALLSWLAVLLNIALIYPAYCIGIKRRHDRDNDGTDLKILIAGSIIINVLQATGIGVDLVDAGQGVVLPVPAIWLGLINLAYAIFAIYMFVQLGFLKGTTGANSYGLDPLDGAA
jgi:uncharacterized membrane protein YhaH (DUF805 family)